MDEAYVVEEAVAPPELPVELALEPEVEDPLVLEVDEEVDEPLEPDVTEDEVDEVLEPEVADDEVDEVLELEVKDDDEVVEALELEVDEEDVVVDDEVDEAVEVVPQPPATEGTAFGPFPIATKFVPQFAAFARRRF